jgi:hypothetical protein
MRAELLAADCKSSETEYSVNDKGRMLASGSCFYLLHCSWHVTPSSLHHQWQRNAYLKSKEKTSKSYLRLMHRIVSKC